MTMSPAAFDTAYKGVVMVSTTAIISGWMLQKMNDTPGRSKCTERELPAS